MADHKSTSSFNARDLLVPYKPPEWAAELQSVPKYKVHLGNDDTPIHRWYLPNIPDDFEVYIKREDMTGAELSGNKVKKLEFILADVVDRGYTTVITAGSIVSNHCRCTALACRRLGLQAHLIVRSPTSNPDEVPCTGNTLLYRMAGAKVYLAPHKADIYTELLPRIQQLADKLKKDKKVDAYPIDMGGSTSIGVFGCIEGFRELMDQGLFDKYSDIAVGVGSAGNVAGLAIGNYLTGSKVRIHGFCVAHDGPHLIYEVNRLLEELGLRKSTQSPSAGPVNAQDIIYIVEDARGLGFTVSEQKELEFLYNVTESTGIVLDATYAGKAAFSLVQQLQENPGRFQGNKILFMHTGGIFGLFDGRMDSVIKQNTTKNIHNWMELSDDVPFQVQ
ncbi:uncharacterized protein [Amphiura filiformis]|uniref:uncharacterized protein n=1 Tax=Amphiura filiformis TaxID=82378 RepID=UPI003B222DC4